MPPRARGPGAHRRLSHRAGRGTAFGRSIHPAGGLASWQIPPGPRPRDGGPLLAAWVPAIIVSRKGRGSKCRSRGTPRRSRTRKVPGFPKPCQARECDGGHPHLSFDRGSFAKGLFPDSGSAVTEAVHRGRLRAWNQPQRSRYRNGSLT